MSTGFTVSKKIFAKILLGLRNELSVNRHQTETALLNIVARHVRGDGAAWDDFKKISDTHVLGEDVDRGSIVFFWDDQMERLVLSLSEAARFGMTQTLARIVSISNHHLPDAQMGSREIRDALSAEKILRDAERSNSHDPDRGMKFTVTEKVVTEIAENLSRIFTDQDAVDRFDVMSVMSRSLHGDRGDRRSSITSEGRVLSTTGHNDLSRRIDVSRDALVEISSRLAELSLTHPAMTPEEVKGFIVRNIPGASLPPLPVKGAPERIESGGVTLSPKALSRIVDRVAAAVRERPEASKSSLLNVVAAEIAGPGHDWGLIKNGGGRKKAEPEAPALPEIPGGPVLVGTHFSICDLPSRAFWDNPDEASAFLSEISSGLVDVMATAGNQYIQDRLEMDGYEPGEDDDGETFGHAAWQEREVNVIRIGSPVMFMKEKDFFQGGYKREVTWVADRAEATNFSQKAAFAMDLPENCAIVPIAIPEPEMGIAPEADPEP